MSAQSQYAQQSDLIVLGIPQATANRFGASAITAQLQAASSLVDTYLPSQFTLPLVTWDQGLRLRVCALAAYELYYQYGIADTDHLVTKRYEQTLSWLEDIRDKKIFPQWVDSSGGTAPTATEAGAYMISDTPAGFTDRGVVPTVPSNAWWPWNF